MHFAHVVSRDKPWKQRFVSCGSGQLFPLRELIDEVKQRDPDKLFFAGHQFYENFAGLSQQPVARETARQSTDFGTRVIRAASHPVDGETPESCPQTPL